MIESLMQNQRRSWSNSTTFRNRAAQSQEAMQASHLGLWYSSATFVSEFRDLISIATEPIVIPSASSSLGDQMMMQQNQQ